MPSAMRRCLDCGTLISLSTSRCGPCTAKREAQRGTRQQRGYDQAWQVVRLEVLARDAHSCHWCGEEATTVDHVVPLAHRGPRLDPANLVAACLRCNSVRGGRTRRRG